MAAGTGGAQDRIRSVVKDCVHCGFCLPACPTYALWGEEMDSPRGRIYLVGQLLDGAPLTPAAGEHFDRCLGCMACMTACPSGVQYDQIIEAAREWTEAADAQPSDEGSDGLGPAGVAPGGAVPEARRPLRDRLTRAGIFALFPYPAPAAAGDRAAARPAADRGRPADRPDRAWSGGSPPPPSRRCGSRRPPPGRCRPGGSPSGSRRAGSGGPSSACSPGACSRCSSPG